MNRNCLKIVAPQGSQLAEVLNVAGHNGMPINIMGIKYIVAGTTMNLEQCEIVYDLVRK